MSSPDVTLHIDRKNYVGWKSVRVSLGLDRLASSFELALTERWASMGEKVSVREGVACEVRIGKDTVLPGYVDESTTSYNARNRSLAVQGRSKLGDLVDCSIGARRYRKQTLGQIARAMCEPFGISVADDVGDTEQFRSFSVEDGETVFEALDRAARMRGVLLVSGFDGALHLTRRGTQKLPTRLVHGKNILSGARRGTTRDRYSDYICKSQAVGDDDFHGKKLSATAEVKDAGIARYRPTVIVAEEPEKKAALEKRATWERNVRAGKAVTYEYTVQGWSYGDGLWVPNYLVPVSDYEFGIEGELLIASVDFVRSNEGTTTTMQLVDPAAYDVLRAPEPKARDPWA